MKKQYLSKLIFCASLCGILTTHQLESSEDISMSSRCICLTNAYCLECEEICNNWCTGWTLAVDYLYWQPIRQNTNYALTDPTGIADAKRFSIDMEWASGYRIDLAKVWGCSMIDTEARYTSFDHSSGPDQRNGPTGGGFIIPTRAEPSSQGALFAVTQSVTGEYTIDYDVVDLLAGHTWECECYDLAFRPFFGVKLAFIDEELASLAVTNSPSNLRFFLDKNNMNLYGLTVGFDGQWRACNGLLSLNFRGATALLYGTSDRRFHKEIGGVQTEPDIIATIHQVVPACEIAVGIGSDIWCTDCFSLNIAIGYDFQGWLIPDFLYPTDGLNNSGLSPDPAVTYPGQDPNAYLVLHGLHVRVAVSF